MFSRGLGGTSSVQLNLVKSLLQQFPRSFSFGSRVPGIDRRSEIIREANRRLVGPSGAASSSGAGVGVSLPAGASSGSAASVSGGAASSAGPADAEESEADSGDDDMSDDSSLDNGDLPLRQSDTWWQVRRQWAAAASEAGPTSSHSRRTFRTEKPSDVYYYVGGLQHCTREFLGLRPFPPHPTPMGTVRPPCAKQLIVLVDFIFSSVSPGAPN
jgi:hypothetical protein